MKPIALFLSICIAASAFVAQDACAAMRTYAAMAAAASGAHASTASDQGILKAARRSKGSKASNRKPRTNKHQYQPEVAHAVAHAKASRNDGLAEARSELIYRSSQFSAPIITNATACKHIGAHGESIYENCQLTTATNGAGGM